MLRKIEVLQIWLIQKAVCRSKCESTYFGKFYFYFNLLFLANNFVCQSDSLLRQRITQEMKNTKSRTAYKSSPTRIIVNWKYKSISSLKNSYSSFRRI